MANSLSPFIANLFMSKFETEAEHKFEYFPRVWFRYVDDILAVFDTKAISLYNFVAKLSNLFPTIKFTYEMEHNEHLPFLDVLVINKKSGRFPEEKKETATLRYIPNDSHHPFQHKMTSFNFLIHRLLSFPLGKERFEYEKNLIKDIAKNYGYSCKDNDPIPNSPLFALINKDRWYGSVNRDGKLKWAVIRASPRQSISVRVMGFLSLSFRLLGLKMPSSPYLRDTWFLASFVEASGLLGLLGLREQLGTNYEMGNIPIEYLCKSLGRKESSLELWINTRLITTFTFVLGLQIEI
ncbi:hypothetical protein NQ318_023472 [Aromia moschata]|uniref:Reverse transcriptase domain-containing protein n=1 Tax=Aromia moschata TaxID=1265417 RepID=A0AAV8YMY7_9CUCU|nr:hypothetical protein NQ318_023472 [Aromia moschata]